MVDAPPKCPFGCDGSGRKRVDENTDVFCQCFTVRLIAQKLGPELCAVRSTLTGGPLYRRSPEGEVVLDGTTKNLFLRGRWLDLVPHLKQALSNRINLAPHFIHRIVTDERLKNIWVGNEAYQSKPKRKRDNAETYNSLADIIGSDIDLVIVRLGFLHHPNVAMPGILLEALALRDSKSKPTWLIEDPDRHGWGYHKRSDISYYLQSNYEDISITGDAAPLSERVREEEDDEPGFGLMPPVSPDVAVESLGQAPRETPQIDEMYTPDDFLDIDGLRDTDRKRFGKKGRRGGFE